jgi:hypothetical protein
MTTSERVGVGGMCRTRPTSGPLGQHRADGRERGQAATAGGRLASFPSADRPEEQSARPWGLGEAVKGDKGQSASSVRQSAPSDGFSKAVKGEGKESLPTPKPK